MKNLIVSALLLTSFCAYAQTNAQRTPAPTPPPQHIEFGSDLIHGEREEPSGISITSRRGTTFKSLIKVRESFSEKLMQSAEEL